MMKDTIRKIINEATSTSTDARGSFVPPLQPGIRYFKKENMGPFTEPVSIYKSPDLAYDSYDGKMERTKKQIKKEESKAIAAYNKIKNNPYATFSDEEGNIINQTPGKNKKIIPIKEWVELDKIDLNEDLAVWFGKKKKPKGSKQPKGPWVNICRKVDGKHPPCGRSDTSKGAYPKCRAAGVAGKMSDSEKRSACQQKRRAEKKDTQTGKGQKPVMTSYKKKKTNEDMKRIVRLTENDLNRIVKKVLLEQDAPPLGDCDFFIMDTKLLDGNLGELHMFQTRPGDWRLQKFIRGNMNPTQKQIRIPQLDEIEVEWDSQRKQIKLTGQSLLGLKAYNLVFNQNADEYSGKIIYASNQNPSEYGGRRSQFILAGTVKLNITEEQPKLLNNSVKLKNGAKIKKSHSYFIGRSGKYKTNKTLSINNLDRVYGAIEIDGIGEFNNGQRKCDPTDVGRD